MNPYDPVGAEDYVGGGPLHGRERKCCQHLLDEDGLEVVLYLNLF
jgi:hypothetical protein